MGDLHVVKYEYAPADFLGSTGHDLAGDLQTKLRALTGGGGGDGSKVRAVHMENCRGMFIVVVVYEG
tara:strand:+ start:4691 stop:4891 length:201 start_codon:yes stop_codon:yes gene_type:complete